MGRAIAIEKLTVIDLEQRFGLERINNDSFFSEWRSPLPKLTEYEQDRLTRIRAIYDNFE